MGAEEGLALFGRIKDEGFRAFSKFLSWLERTGPAAAFEIPELRSPPKLALRIGITGPPGAGKSTLVGALLERLTKNELGKQKLRIGVLAVDPSSPFTRGAILGDRIRYREHFLNPDIFIRSLGTRGSLGGLSGAAFLMARAFDAAEFDVLLIETVGVGQTELDVLHVADRVGVVLVPESGDSIQAMKAGLMEIADFFVVNKADRPGAEALGREIEASLHDGLKTKSIYLTVADRGEGVDQLAADLLAQGHRPSRAKRDAPARLREEARSLLRAAWEETITARLGSIQDVESLRRTLTSQS